MKQRNVIVVGGGLAGLATAAFGAKAGHRVTVLERASALGGRAQTQDRGGFALNLGAHALYPEASRALAELGVVVSGAKPPASGLALDRGALHTLPGGFVSLLTTSLLSVRAKMEVGRLLGSIPSMDGAPLMSTPVSDFLATIRDDAARRLMAGVVRVSTYAADHERMSLGVAIEQIKIALTEGVTYVDGGWRNIVEGLERAAVGAGANVRTGDKVERVERDGRDGYRVRLASGASLAADAVVIAASPEAARALAPDVDALARAASGTRRVTAASLDLALSIVPKARARFVLGLDRPLYLSVHSAVAKLAPEGGSVVHAMMYGAPEDGEAAERELDELVARVIPEAREGTVHRRFLPSLIVTHDLPTAERGGYAGRTPVRVPGETNLFLAGDWVGARGLLADASLLSAREAAGAISEGVAGAPVEVRGAA